MKNYIRFSKELDELLDKYPGNYYAPLYKLIFYIFNFITFVITYIINFSKNIYNYKKIVTPKHADKSVQTNKLDNDHNNN
jgi:hypothetical protein